jgi:flagellar hook protein FlgE
MGMLTSLFTGVSGLGANGAALSTIGDNIANSNTVGFKASRTQFGDILSQSTGGSNTQVGRGVSVTAVQGLFTQGTVQSSSNPLDMAIEGEGFFIVEDTAGGSYYTRDGELTMDKSGNIVNASGMILKGKLLTGDASGTVGTINIASLNSPPKASTLITANANLNSSETVVPSEFIMQSANNAIKYTDAAGNTGLITIPTGNYSASGLATAIKTAINTALGNPTSNPASATYFDVTYNNTTKKMDYSGKVPAGGGNVTLSWTNAGSTAKDILGFDGIADSVFLANATTLKSSDVQALGNSTAFGIVINANDTVQINGVDYNLITAGNPLITGPNFSGQQLAAKLQSIIVASNLAAYHPGAADLVTVTYNEDNVTNLNKFKITNNSAVDLNMNFGKAATTCEAMLGFTSNDIVISSAGDSATSDFYAVGFNPDSAASTSAFSTSVSVYDSLGYGHLMSIYFKKTSENTAVTNNVTGNRWHWYAVVQANDSQTGQTQVGGSGYLDFNTDGALVSDSGGGGLYSSYNFAGGVTQDQRINIDFGASIVESSTGKTGSTQYGSASSVTYQTQDGYSSGSLTGLQTSADGTIAGTFTNGQTQRIAQVYLARFTAPEALSKMGKNVFSESFTSGTPIVGAPGTSGRGTITPSSLETSGVDLASEFVTMIAAQRGFQANARVITTTDEMLTELMNLKR